MTEFHIRSTIDSRRWPGRGRDLGPKIIGITGTLIAFTFTFAIGSVPLLAFRRVGMTGPRVRLPGMQMLAPAAFAVASLIYGLALLGPYDGLGVLPEPWGSIVVAAAGLALYSWGVRSAVAYLRHRPGRVDELRDEADRDRELVTVG